MDKKIFINRLQSATQALIEFTSPRVTNVLTDNYKYLVVPNDRHLSDHLNDREITLLAIINRFENKKLSAEQCIKLLWDDGKVPLWINMSVYETDPKKTVIELICSRRFRDDKDLNHKVSYYPPFSIGIPLPPNAFELKEGQKFDINWKKRLTERKTLKGFITSIKNLFRPTQQGA